MNHDEPRRGAPVSANAVPNPSPPSAFWSTYFCPGLPGLAVRFTESRLTQGSGALISRDLLKCD